MEDGTLEAEDCRADWSLRSIAAIRSGMLGVLHIKDNLSIDCSAITSCDITAVQLLVSLSMTARKTGRDMRLVGVPDILRATMLRAGVSLALSGDRNLVSEV